MNKRKKTKCEKENELHVVLNNQLSLSLTQEDSESISNLQNNHETNIQQTITLNDTIMDLIDLIAEIQTQYDLISCLCREYLGSLTASVGNFLGPTTPQRPRDTVKVSVFSLLSLKLVMCGHHLQGY